jgi:hypothetical protein
VTLPATPRTQALLMGLSTIFTAVLIMLIVALNAPFAQGSGRLSPKLIDETAASMAQAAPDVAARPCPQGTGP